MDDRIHIIKLNPSSRKEKQKMPDDREGLLPFTERTEDGIRIFRYADQDHVSRGGSQMNISQLECFLSVANHLSFANAAEELSISQPAVSHQIQSLENELGGKLFHRTTRTVTLTEAGKMFYEDAKRIVTIARTAIHRFENPQDSSAEPFNIGCPSPMITELICRSLAEMKNIRKNLHPSMLNIPGPLITARTEDGTVDAGVWFEDKVHKRSGLRYREICRTPIVYGVSSHMGDLSEERIESLPMILCCGEDALPEIIRLQEDRAANKLPSELFFCDCIESSVEMARAGFGTVILPEIFIKDDEDMQKLPVGGTEPLSLGVYYRQEDGNDNSRQLAKILKEMA